MVAVIAMVFVPWLSETLLALKLVPLRLKLRFGCPFTVNITCCGPLTLVIVALIVVVADELLLGLLLGVVMRTVGGCGSGVGVGRTGGGVGRTGGGGACCS